MPLVELFVKANDTHLIQQMNCHFFTDWSSPRASDHIVGVYALRNAVPNVGGNEHRNIVMQKINEVQLLFKNR